MALTTFYQSRQMQRASPASTQQQQMMTRIMPIMFAFFGFVFPAGLVIYYTTTNLVQIIQQHYMLPQKPGDAPPPEPRKGSGDGRGKAAPGQGRIRGTQDRRPAGSQGRRPAPGEKRAPG